MPDLELLPDVHDVAVLQITIQNPTSYATASPHVQHIAIQNAYLSWLLGVPIDARNIAFGDPQANALAPSWYSGFDGTYHHFFIKTGQIPASSSYTLYLIYSYKKTLIDGKTAGISAWAGQYLYGIPYGQLDNGSSIFLLYDNFAGTSLSSAWTQYLNGNSISVNNGLTMTAQSGTNGNMGLVRSLTPVSTGAAVHMMYDVLQCCGCNGGNDLDVVLGYSLSYPWSGYGYGTADYSFGGSQKNIVKSSNGVTLLVSLNTSCSVQKNIFYLFEWLYTTTSYLYHYDNINANLSATDSSYNPSSITQIELGASIPNANTASYLIHHVAVYDPPPVQPDLPVSISAIY